MEPLNITQAKDVIAKANAVITQRVYIEKRLVTTQAAMQAAQDMHLAAQQARLIVLAVARQTQQVLETRLTSIGTMALAAVFPNPYEFLVRFVERRNQTEVDLLLVREGEEFSPIDSAGGGVLDVLSFALRVAALAMQPRRRVIVLDEPFKHLSADLQGKASAMVKMLATELNIQFIMVSHEEGIIECADIIHTLPIGENK